MKLSFLQGIEQQFAALQKGFTEVVPQHLLKPFDERELELIIGGLGKIDIDDWKANTRLKVSIVCPSIMSLYFYMPSLLSDLNIRTSAYTTLKILIIQGCQQ